jgi:hypothetical protein
VSVGGGEQFWTIHAYAPILVACAHSAQSGAYALIPVAVIAAHRLGAWSASTRCPPLPIRRKDTGGSGRPSLSDLADTAVSGSGAWIGASRPRNR